MALNFRPPSINGWQPGQSGNPKGRPRERDRDTLQDLCRAQTEEAVKTLIVCMRNPKERLPAAIAILDRGWGKPKQVIEAEGGVTNVTLHLLAAQLVSEQLAAQQQQPPTLNAEPEQAAVNLLNAPLPSE